MNSIRNTTAFSDSDDVNIPQSGSKMDQNQAAVYRCTVRRRIWPLRRKKKKLPTVRLGGKRQLLVKVFKRIRMRWMKMKKACTLKKLKGYYYSVLKDVIEAGGSFETFQQRLMLETSFAVPVMGLSFNTYH
ncbi:hypothetical protein L1987_67166 [Smallanthus sonchifolius]|uniref:Uncharacterized protein n=1 Tax=Smallanthus sonchifolius TaxID=185202 RepID=A0ACB9BZ61_9ASTR|nr:hypothetical protein L1987_67166 [Smallanthus sonchifolius]